MSGDDHSVQVERALVARRKPKIITALTTLPPGWVSASLHQYTISRWCGQNLHGHFLRVILPIIVELVLGQGSQWKDKRAQNSITKVCFYTIIVRLSQRTTAIMMASWWQSWQCSQNLLCIARHNFLYTRSVIDIKFILSSTDACMGLWHCNVPTILEMWWRPSLTVMPG